MSDIDTSPRANNRLRPDMSSFSVPQYAALGLMVLAVVILGLWFMSWSTTPTWQVVASGLTPDQAAEATDELQAASIENRLTNGGSAIEVPTGSAAEATVALGDLVTSAGGAEGYELLDDQGFITSSFTERVNYQRAVEGELSKTILLMEDVTSATVHLAIPEDRLFSDEEVLTRASVVVGGSISQSTVASIANVVASAVPDLDPGNITIADTSGRVLSGGNDTGFSSDQQLRMQDVFEAQLAMTAESMLAVALGPGRAVVRVSAELNFDELEASSVTYDTENQATLREQTSNEAFTGDQSVPLGTLGTVEDVTDIGDIASENGNAYIRRDLNREFGVPSTTTTSRQAPGSVERLSVAVILDDSLDPAPDTAALTPLIAAAVGIDAERGDTIVVESMTFDTSVAEAIEAAEPLAAAAGEGLEPIIGYVKTGAAVIGMLLALFFLQKGLKTLLPIETREPAALATPRVAELPKAEETATAALTSNAANLESPASSTTIDMLDLIDSQSDQVAHLLRDLVSEGAG